ncbi:cop9 signalosome complex subunit 3 [Cystoisospora suis]|uniref:Cop9 signalosome complex subunit 3 n=1 Tax=Cystoisospora suis TaxID=483139 RepID=A0A2C6L278_9APIC|nr:cop9 signalosome complex subunit 3 [Cystoisospora suis]
MSRSVSFSVACSRTPWEYIPKKMAEPLVPLVMRLSGDGGTGWGLETLQSLLQARKTRLTDSATELHEALKKLSPKTHALGLCHVLSALWSEEEVTVAFNATLELLERCEAEQIQQCPVEFTSVTRAAVAFAIRGHSDAESEGTQQESTRLKCMEQATPATSELCSLCSNCPPALRLLKPLRRAVQKFRKDAHEVTSSDTDFLRLCVHGQWYKEALPVIDREAYRVHKDFCRKLGDCAEYLYLAGRTWIALENYERARRVLDLGLSLPSTPEIIHTQISAYMHYALLSRMLLGSIPRPPPPSPGVEEAMKLATYQLLFTPNSSSSRGRSGVTVPDSNSTTRSLQAREQDLQTYAGQLKSDGTWDLAVIALAIIKRRQVQEIGKFFSTIPIDRFEAKMGFSSREETLQFLCSDSIKSICQLDHGLEMITFNEEKDEPSGKEKQESSPSTDRKAMALEKKESFFLLKKQLDEALQQVALVTKHLHEAENQVVRSEAYQTFCRQLEALGARPGFHAFDTDSNDTCFVPEGLDEGEDEG